MGREVGRAMGDTGSRSEKWPVSHEKRSPLPPIVPPQAPEPPPGSSLVFTDAHRQLTDNADRVRRAGYRVEYDNDPRSPILSGWEIRRADGAPLTDADIEIVTDLFWSGSAESATDGAYLDAPDVGWFGRQALRGGSRWHVACFLLTIFYWSSLALTVTAYVQLRRHEAQATAHGRAAMHRALGWIIGPPAVFLVIAILTR